MVETVKVGGGRGLHYWGGSDGWEWQEEDPIFMF